MQNGHVGTSPTHGTASAAPTSSKEPTQAERTIAIIGDVAMRTACFEHAIKEHAPDLKVESVSGPADIRGRASLVILDAESGRTDPKRLAEVFANIVAIHGTVPVMLIVEDEDLAFAKEALRMGARGFVSTSLAGEMVLAAIRLVLAGGTFISPGLVAHCAGRGDRPAPQAPAAFTPPRTQSVAHLTRREQEIVDQLKTGRPNKIIAYELHMSESTVKTHLRNIMRKARATNRTQLAMLAESVTHQ